MALAADLPTNTTALISGVRYEVLQALDTLTQSWRSHLSVPFHQGTTFQMIVSLRGTPDLRMKSDGLRGAVVIVAADEARSGALAVLCRHWSRLLQKKQHLGIDAAIERIEIRHLC